MEQKIRVMNREEKMFVTTLGLLLILSIFLMQAGCASPHAARDIDTVVSIPAQVDSNSRVGVKNGMMIYQRKTLMSEEMRSIQNQVYELEARVYGGPRYYDMRGLYGVLKDCRAELGEASNGGEGKIHWLEARDYVTAEDELTQIGVENKTRLVGLSEEYLKDRIDRFREYKKILLSREDEFETKVKSCEVELRSQKVASH